MANILYGMPVADAINRFTWQQFTQSSRFTMHGIPQLTIIQMGDGELCEMKRDAIMRTAKDLGIHTNVIKTSVDGARIRSIIENVCDIPDQWFIVVSDDHYGNASMWLGDMPSQIIARDLDAICQGSMERFYTDHHPQYGPAVAIAILAFLRYYEIDFVKRPVVVVGRSSRVGRAIAHLLSRYNATVSLLHNETPLKVAASIMWDQPDAIIITATGASSLIAMDSSMGQIIINVGMHYQDGEIKGDLSDDVLAIYDHSPVIKGIDDIVPSIICAKMARDSTATVLEYIMSDDFPAIVHPVNGIECFKLLSSIEHTMTTPSMGYTVNEDTRWLEIIVNHGVKVHIDTTAVYPMPRTVTLPGGANLVISYYKGSRCAHLTFQPLENSRDVDLTFTEFG